jgi:hypothetical protein
MCQIKNKPRAKQLVPGVSKSGWRIRIERYMNSIIGFLPVSKLMK